MPEQIPLSKDAIADLPNDPTEDGMHDVTTDVAYKRLGIVNIAVIGAPGATDGQWALIDAGISGTAGLIRRAAEHRFGKNARPAAILMTHAHFDHVGALKTLADAWDVPVYAHRLELPYLAGVASYPPPDPTVGGGMMSLMSPLFPRSPVDLSDRVQPLPDDGMIPGFPDWRWLPTPGHTPGHVSFWRATDRVLIAGDAFITTRQESAYAALTQVPEMHGPPMYFTQDWEAAHRSVEMLAALDIETAVTGHGKAMGGEELRMALTRLAREFQDVAVPKTGKYVQDPATVARGAYR